MAEINKDNLEKALDTSNKNSGKEAPKMPKEMEIGFHQGSLSTLLNERNEMVKIIQQIERVMQMHLKRLEELGVKVKVQKSESKKKE